MVRVTTLSLVQFHLGLTLHVHDAVLSYSGLVITCHVTGTSLIEAQKLEMIRYLRNVQREDGGWGL